jgi:hypothetical protein
LSGQEAEKFLRHVERETLDRVREKYSLWAIHPSIAFDAMLLAVDSMALSMSEMGRLSTTGSAPPRFVLGQRTKAIQEGLTVALRWLYPRITGTLYDQPTEDALISDAGNLLLHAIDYHRLEVFHRGLGQGLYRVTACQDTRKIRFSPETIAHARSVVAFDDLVDSERNRAQQTGDRIRELICDRASASPPVLIGGRISAISALGFVDAKMLQIARVGALMDVISLDDSKDMGGFSVGEFKAFWIVLDAWSRVLTSLYLLLCYSGHPQEECMPTPRLRRDQFLCLMAEKTRLSLEVVGRIADFLTYSLDVTRPDAYLQPLFSDGVILTWSALIVARSRQPRNAIKLLCQRSRTRNLGATLNGSREKSFLRQLGQFLEKRGQYAFKIAAPISDGESEGEIDLLAYRRSCPGQVLLVQAKTPIAADDNVEIAAVTRDLEEGARQSLRAEDILRRMPTSQKASLFKFVDWSRVRSYHHLVVTPDSEMGGKYGTPEIPAISLVAMQLRLRALDCVNPAAICNACRTRAWLDPIVPTEVCYEPLIVGDVIYELPCFVVAASG